MVTNAAALDPLAPKIRAGKSLVSGKSFYVFKDFFLGTGIFGF